MEIIGYVMAAAIGVSLGLIGSGGSILAVPVFTYLFLLNEKTATAYSLFTVGIGALVGGLKQSQNNNVDWRTAFVFGTPALVGVWLVRHYVVPALPDVIFNLNGYVFTRRMGMFGVFAILMCVAAYTMISGKERKGGSGDVKYNYLLILIEGLVVGGVTGFVGAGGGFLIIPTLVILASIEIKKAIGTSLIIIAFKSILGFLFADALSMRIGWTFLSGFTTLTVVGIFVGVYIGRFIDGRKLKKGFGYFIMLMGVFIFIMEFFIKH